MSTVRLRERGRSARPVAWHLLQALTVAAVAHTCWMLFSGVPYLIDADVYRMGGRAWLQGQPLYADGVRFQTEIGLGLPFTYPPLAAVAFAPLALVSLPTASVAITVVTCVLLVVSTWIVLTRLDVAEDWPVGGSARARRWWLAAGLVALAAWWFEPLLENFRFGQVNVILMTLVIADCVPRRTPWPRGVLVGLAIALKLTPAVFLLYFVLRRDVRAVLTALASFGAATLAGFALAWRDSWEYWGATVHRTDRIGNPTLNTNQNAAGALARLSLGETTHFLVWTTACLVVLGITIWSVRRVLAAGGPAAGPTMAVMCVALFGLVVSPVSWSHHWVWALPTITVTAVLAYRRRDPVLAALAAVGVALMVWSPIQLLPEHQEAQAAWWRQLLGMSYVWWAVAVIVLVGLRSPSPRRSPESAPTAQPAPPAPPA